VALFNKRRLGLKNEKLTVRLVYQHNGYSDPLPVAREIFLKNTAVGKTTSLLETGGKNASKPKYSFRNICNKLDTQVKIVTKRRTEILYRKPENWFQMPL
jgi:hypothetical protein